MRNLTSRRIAPLVVGVTAVIALAACGSSSKATVSPGAQPADATTTTVKTAPKVVSAGTTTKLGVVLVDDKGMTLYTLTKDGSPVACTGQCAMTWPPLLVPAGTTKVSALTGVTGLATAPGDGGTQVTAGGLPLYRFAGDAAAGDTNGDGIANFGGVWHVVKAGSGVVPPTTTPPATSATTDTTAASSGYGY